MNLRNTLPVNDLLVNVGTISYDYAVTDRQFWTAVAEKLVLRRNEQGVRSPNAVKRLGGPTYKTVEQIEAGNIGQVDKLAAYAGALKLSLVDLFRSVLISEDREFTPELEQIIRKYQRADLEGRAAIVGVARVVREREPEEQTRDGQPGLRVSTPTEEDAGQRKQKRK